MHKNRSVRNSDAVFIGWQQTPWGAPIALYNIIAVGHPSFGSTVLEATLRKFHLKIPRIPPQERRAKKRPRSRIMQQEVEHSINQ
jgi:hypothetical protein